MKSSRHYDPSATNGQACHSMAAGGMDSNCIHSAMHGKQNVLDRSLADWTVLTDQTAGTHVANIERGLSRPCLLWFLGRKNITNASLAERTQLVDQLLGDRGNVGTYFSTIYRERAKNRFATDRSNSWIPVLSLWDIGRQNISGGRITDGTYLFFQLWWGMMF